MKKCRFFAICLILVISCLPFTSVNAMYNSFLEELNPRSEIFLLQSLEDDVVIFDKNADQRTPPASLTKLVTAILTMENCPDLGAMVAVPQSVLDALVNTGSSNAGLRAGEELSVADLLRCMLIPSANEAAATLAYYVSGGDIDGFVEKMNVFVDRLGCTNTHFMTPHGLDAEGQYTCASDVAKIMKYALTFSYSELFREILSSKQYTLPASNKHPEPRIIRTTNKMLNSGISDYYCKYVVGGKTGSTSQAGKCVAAFAEDGGYSYLVIVMNAPFDDYDHDNVEENGAFTDAKLLLDWVFEKIRYECVLQKTEILGEATVRLSSKTDHVMLLPADDVYAYVPKGVDDKSVLAELVETSLPESVDAPVRKGDKLAEARVMYADEEIVRVDLVASEDVDRSFFLWVGSLIAAFFRLKAVKVILILLGAAVVGFIGLMILGTYNRNKQRKIYNSNSKVVRMNEYKKKR